MDITDPGNYGAAIQNVNYDQVAEVKVQTGSFTADTAHGPVVLNAISKAGGSDFHGSLYAYARTYQLNTVDWIAKYTGTPPSHDREIYPGFTIGGPVRIPGLGFNRSKKLTFFAAAEEYAQRKVYAYNSAYSATVSAFVPTAGMRNGDFSDNQLNLMLGPERVNNACPSSIYVNICSVPTSGVLGTNAQPLGLNTIATTPTGNTTPFTTATDGNLNYYTTGGVQSYDPQGVGKSIINSLPLPNVTSNGSYNYVTTDFVNSNLYQIKARLDYALSDKTHIFLAYSLQSGLQYNPSSTTYRPGANGQGGGLDMPAPAGKLGGFSGTATSNVVSTEVTTNLSASLTNTFYAGGAYFSQIFNLRYPSLIQKETYSLLFNNGSTALPSLGTYGASNFDGYPFWTGR